MVLMTIVRLPHFELRRCTKTKDPMVIAIEFDEIAKKKLQKGPGNQSKFWIIQKEHLPSPEDRSVAFNQRSLLTKKKYAEEVVTRVYQEIRA